ncbi:MAG TPA: hypothetical protein VKV26_06650 [Dehalococcoidia bacterium]|nr:hypothetical protein [Dehalococcoidia bacterium]
MNDPVPPYDPNDYPTSEGASGGLRRRLSGPHGPYAPVSRPRRTRRPSEAASLPERGSRHSRGPRRPRTSRNDGGHSAQRTPAHGGGHAQALHRPRGEGGLPPELQQLAWEMNGVLTSAVTGPVLGFAYGSSYPLGHHPRADGKQHAPSTQHQGLARRGTIVSYNSSTNTAVVRFGDTPDSPAIAIPVSPMISSAVAGAATLAGVQLWNNADPTDALITAVL